MHKDLMGNRCKHDFGWVSKDNINIFFGDEKAKWSSREKREPSSISFEFQGVEKMPQKIKVVCNRRCGATRNVYIKAVPVKWGRIK